MLVALLSDIHDHTTHLLLALQAAREQQCTHLLFMLESMKNLANSRCFSLPR